MAPSPATVESWIEGFRAAHEVERAVRRAGDVAHTAAIALQLSDAALAACAPAMRARREAGLG